MDSGQPQTGMSVEGVQMSVFSDLSTRACTDCVNTARRLTVHMSSQQSEFVVLTCNVGEFQPWSLLPHLWLWQVDFCSRARQA